MDFDKDILTDYSLKNDEALLFAPIFLNDIDNLAIEQSLQCDSSVLEINSAVERTDEFPLETYSQQQVRNLTIFFI